MAARNTCKTSGTNLIQRAARLPFTESEPQTTIDANRVGCGGLGSPANDSQGLFPASSQVIPTQTDCPRTSGRVLRLSEPAPALAYPALTAAAEVSSIAPRQLKEGTSDDESRKPSLLSEPQPNGESLELRQLTRKHPLREVARGPEGEPVMVRLDLIRGAYANCGLTLAQIGRLIGKSRYTVAAALRVDPRINFYTFCEVMATIGVEMAELFPAAVPKRKPMLPTWSRGPYLRENAARRLREEDEREAMGSRPGRRRRK